MKIMQVIIGFDVGGAEMMLKRLVESHHGNSIYQHSVVSLTYIGKLASQFQSMGIDVYALVMNSIFSIPLVLLRLVGLIRANQPGIVQTWMDHAEGSLTYLLEQEGFKVLRCHRGNGSYMIMAQRGIPELHLAHPYRAYLAHLSQAWRYRLFGKPLLAASSLLKRLRKNLQ